MEHDSLEDALNDLLEQLEELNIKLNLKHRQDMRKIINLVKQIKEST